jgi:hypothetical protein
MLTCFSAINLYFPTALLFYLTKPSNFTFEKSNDKLLTKNYTAQGIS